MDWKVIKDLMSNYGLVKLSNELLDFIKDNPPRTRNEIISAWAEEELCSKDILEPAFDDLKKTGLIFCEDGKWYTSVKNT